MTSEHTVSRLELRDFYHNEDVQGLLNQTPQFSVTVPSFNNTEMRKSSPQVIQQVTSVDVTVRMEDDISFYRNSFTN